MSWALGIDPGADGAMVALQADGELLGAWRAGGPHGYLRDAKEGGYLAALDQARELGGCQPGLVVLEGVQLRGGQGLASQAKAAYGIGVLAGLLQAKGWPWVETTPQRWRKALSIPSDKANPKAPTIAWVERLLPQLDLRPGRCMRPHDGLADAGAIASYALWMLRGAK